MSSISWCDERSEDVAGSAEDVRQECCGREKNVSARHCCLGIAKSTNGVLFV